MLIFTPAETNNVSAVVYPADSNGLPGLYIQDEDQDGHADVFLIADSSGRYVCLDDDDSDGKFDAFTYNTGFAPDSYSLDDKNMDGVYDQKLGPGRNLFVNIAGNWHELEFDAGKHFVTIDGKPMEVIVRNHIWSLRTEDEPQASDLNK